MKRFRWIWVIFMTAAVMLPLAQAAVVINEVYYDASGTDLDHEFLELYNNGSTAVNISGWTVEWAGMAWNYGTYTFPPNTTIQPNDYLLVGGSLTQADFGITPDLIHAFTFQNGPETDGVRINNGSGYYDTILYGTPNTNGLRGDEGTPGTELCPDVASGHSLERVNVGVDNNLASDWVDRLTPTPHRSSTMPGNNPPQLTQTLYYPDVVSPIDQVNVTCRASDDYELVSVNIRYQVNGGGYARYTVAMFDDGNHGDGLAGDSIFGGYIPAYTVDDEIEFYTQATDDSGLVVSDPPTAPAAVYGYTILNTALSTIASIKPVDLNGNPLYQDSLVMVKGLIEVTTHYGYSGPAYMRDATGGIAVYGTSVTTRGIAIGDSVKVTGWLDGYAGLIEIADEPLTGTPEPVFIILSRGHAVDPQVVTISQLGEATEGLLVRVNSGHFLVSGNFQYLNYQYVVGTDTTEVRIDDNTNIIGTPIPSGTCDVIGCLGQYDLTAPLFSGYQILSRFRLDIITAGNQPPAVGNTLRSPLIPTPTDPVWITSRVSDDHGLTDVSLFYRANGGGWSRTQVTMYDDGMHHDGAAGDSIYGANIPAHPVNDVMDYYVSATDDSSATTTDPVGAPSAYFSYTVTSGLTITPISYVRANNATGMPLRMDSLFTVIGLVTASTEFGTRGPAFLQDATGGIGLYDYDGLTVYGFAIGDSIRLTGWVGFSTGLTEFVDDPLNAANNPIVAILNSGNTVTPLALTLSQAGETYEGQFVIFNSVTFVETGTFNGSTTYHIIQGSDTLDVYIDYDTNIPGNLIPAGVVNIQGIMSQYDVSSPYFEGYQLQPRMFSDIITSTLSAVDDLEIRRSGTNIVLDWNDVFGAADYKVYYSSSATGPWSVLAATTGGATTYLHTGGAAASVLKRFYYVTATD